jgi:uncharacterized protein (TIGR00255 family)
MQLSMTGYGKSSGEINNKKIVVEIKSLNSKQADISTKISTIYRDKDLEIRNLLNSTLERGKIDFILYIDSSTKENGVKINQSVVKSYLEQLKELSETTGIPATNDWMSLLMRLPDTLKTDNEEIDETEWLKVLELVESALNQLIEFRIQEGEALEEVFKAKIFNIEKLLNQIEPFENERIEKLKGRIEENLQNLSEKIEYDKNRLEQELIFYIEKLDINEEKTRLKNHLSYFIETMNKEKSAGRKLGFITQEIGREINTMGSKSNHSEMQKIVVMMKDELEQIKEQVLNTL